MKRGARVQIAIVAAGLLAASTVEVRAQELGLPRAGPSSASMRMPVHGLGALRSRAAPSATSIADAEPSDSHSDGLPPEVKQAIACVASGTAATAVAVYAGAENLVNLIAGGTVPTANSVVLAIGVVGIVFTSFCAIAQAVTPFVLYNLDGVPAEPPGAPAPRRQARETRAAAAPQRVTFQAGVLGGAATNAARRMGATAFAAADASRPPPEDLVTVLVAAGH